MGDIAIQVEGLSKRYQIGKREQYKSLRESLTGALTAPLRRLCNASNGSGAATDTMWALKDVSFEVKKGEVIGIIGRNGAGKSTLLKVLSRITKPTEGHARVWGRVGSLLEVGTGFHPELSGRENIFLNGAILGMKRPELHRRFDEIVAFADVEKFLDTPVKHYSSGMYMRLAFAVAAHLEPEILIVDEVLAVGDMQFQRKCLGRMGNVAREGRTVLFVSHNIPALKTLCTRGLLLDHGRVAMDGSIEEATQSYLQGGQSAVDVSRASIGNRLDRTSGCVRFSSITAEDDDGRESWTFGTGTTVQIRFEYEAFDAAPGLGVYLAIRSVVTGETVTTFKETVSTEPVGRGSRGTVFVRLPKIPLRAGDYSVYLAIGDQTCSRFFDVVDENVSLPFLVITSNEQDPHRTRGYVTLPAQVRRIEDSVA